MAYPGCQDTGYPAQQYPPQQQQYPPQQQQYPQQQQQYPQQQYAAAQPYMGVPQQQYGGYQAVPTQQTTYVVYQEVLSPVTFVQPTPPMAPPGGYWTEESYCGPASCCIGVFLLPCICCCPIDRRQVYISPDGRKFLATGEVVA
jgi:hypothetical protein